jgi:hypothetical protein
MFLRVNQKLLLAIQLFLSPLCCASYLFHSLIPILVLYALLLDLNLGLGLMFVGQICFPSLISS